MSTDAIRRLAADKMLCPDCSGQIREQDGKYFCAQCGKEYPANSIGTAGDGRKGVLIAWEDLDTNDLLYVHPQGGHIPPYSVLVVKQNQMALYRASGRYYLFEEGIYPAFCEGRDEEQIARTAYESGNLNPEVPLQLDTALIFFSTRTMEFRAKREDAVPVGGTGFYLAPDMTIQYRITDPQAVLEHLSPKEEPSGRFEELIAQIVAQKLVDHLAGRFTDQILFTATAKERLSVSLSQYFSGEAFGLMEDSVNRELGDMGEGIEVPYIRLDFHGCLYSAQEWEGMRSSRAKCPCCEAYMDDLKADLSCPKCGAKIHWCRSAHRYMPVAGKSACPYCYKVFLI